MNEVQLVDPNANVSKIVMVLKNVQSGIREDIFIYEIHRCAYICSWHTHACAHTHTYVYVCVYIHMYTHMYICIYILSLPLC